MKKFLFLLAVAFVMNSFSFDMSAEPGFTQKWLKTSAEWDPEETPTPPAWFSWYDCMAESIRGIAYYDGKVYMPSRKDPNVFKIIVADALTGTTLPDIILPLDTTAKGTLKINDIAVTEDGEFIVANLAAASQTDNPANNFIVYKFADNTFTGMTKLIEFKAEDVYGLAVRLGDGISVYGSLSEAGDGYILAPAAGLDVVFKFVVEGGVHTRTEEIFATEFFPTGTVTAPITNFGTAPRCFAAENYMYIDGKDLAPSIYDFGGNMLDSFKGEVGPEQNNMNGVAEFTLQGKTYVVCTNSTYTMEPQHSVALFEIPEAGMSQAVKISRFPEKGMGKNKATSMIMGIAVDVVNDEAYADIYVQCPVNGVGCFRLEVVNGVENNTASNVYISSDFGQILCDREVRSIELFNLSGQKVASVQNARSIAAAKGLYIVKVIDNEGASKVAKSMVF